MSEHESEDNNFIPNEDPQVSQSSILKLKKIIQHFFSHPYVSKLYPDSYSDPVQLYPSNSFRTIDVSDLDHSSGLLGIKGTQSSKGFNLNEASNKQPISTFNLLFPHTSLSESGIPRLFVEQDPASFYLSYIHLFTRLVNKLGTNISLSRQLNFFHLLAFYLLCMLLNYTALHHIGVRFEWLILCALMIRSGSRAWELSPVVFMFWILVYITSNILLWLAISLDRYFFNTTLHDFYYLCDFILYIYSIAKIWDYGILSWVLAIVLTIISHYFSKILPEYNFSTSVCGHAMAFAFYLCTSETLVQVIFAKNKSYSNPVLGFDRSDLVHNYRYLVMSGKLHPISLPNHYSQESNHFGKWYQAKHARGAGLELQSSSDQILWPNGEAILDSFELCVAGIESNSVHLSWSIPMSLLYPLSRSKTLMKEASEQDRLLLNISLPLNPNELMTHPIHPSCVDKNDIIVRLDDRVYRDWNYDPHTNSLLVFGLQPLCNYLFTVSILGFRSMKCYVTTLPETLDTLSIDNTDNQTHSDINQVINIQRQVDEARRLKKEEQSNLKKLKRDKSQLESRTQSLLNQTLKSIHRAQTEEQQLVQKIQTQKDQMESNESWIQSSDDLRTELSYHKSQLASQIESKKKELSAEHEKLNEIKKSVSDLQLQHQKEHDQFNHSIKVQRDKLTKIQTLIKDLERQKQILIEQSIPCIQKQIQAKKDLFGQLTWCKDYIKRLKKKSIVNKSDSSLSNIILPEKEKISEWIQNYNTQVEGLKNTTQELKTTVASEEAFCSRLEEELEKIRKKKKSDIK